MSDATLREGDSLEFSWPEGWAGWNCGVRGRAFEGRYTGSVV